MIDINDKKKDDKKEKKIIINEEEKKEEKKEKAGEEKEETNINIVKSCSPKENIYKKNTRQKKKKYLKKPGRKWFDGRDEKEILNKLQQAWLMGATDEEACLYAEISVTSLHNYTNKNKSINERKKLLKKSPIFKARRNITNAIDSNNVEVSKWYLERKSRAEFGKESENKVNNNFLILPNTIAKKNNLLN